MGDQTKSKGSKSLFRAFRSASDSNLPKDPSGGPPSRQSDSPKQSPREQKPQQAALSPHITGRSGRLLNKFGWKSRSSSPLPSPSPEVAPHNTDHHTATPASQSLAVLPQRPHSAHLETFALQSHGPSPRDSIPLAAGCNVTAGGSVAAISLSDHDPSSPNVQGSPPPPVSTPIIQVSYITSETIAGENPTPLSTCTQVQPLDVQVAALPMLSPGPGTIEPPPHSSVVWAKALEIATMKLSNNNLPPLDLTNLTSQSAEDNIEAVITALNAWQKDDTKRRWSYTWHGKEIIVVERLGKILKSVDKYSKVVDTVIQCNPQVSALVWAGVWAIMRVRT